MLLTLTTHLCFWQLSLLDVTFLRGWGICAFHDRRSLSPMFFLFLESEQASRPRCSASILFVLPLVESDLLA